MGIDYQFNSDLKPIDLATIQPPSEDRREELEKICRVAHITQIRQATMVRVCFDKSLKEQSSGVRMLNGDSFTLRVKYEIDTENPPIGLRIRHWNGGFGEFIVEHPLSIHETTADFDFEFSARDENGDVLEDIEAHVPMQTQIIDEQGIVYAQVNWHTGINDIF
ncbi:hypothetical protein M3Y98_00456400 [Aphelenchoides besseyi]|nr:hypothetical protein M3Y98_00456400 [Aphelenchoides besseyi]KAI6207454.1 hypothetical protein M3Y96_00010600 [Aphelenchoides besseyi]